MRATWNGAVIAESDETVVVENNHYFPRSALVDDHFSASDLTTVCSWKGTAQYLSVTVGGQTNPDAAWYYDSPLDAAVEIKDHVAFWRGVQVS